MELNEEKNEELNEKKRFPYFKVILGIIAVVAIVFGGIGIERIIDTSVKDVNIKKTSLSADKVKFINVKPLDTKIMAVIASDGTVRTAFDDCLSCYYNDGVRAHFTDTGKSVVCDNCGCETFYDDMGILSYECTPYPILSDYRDEDDHTIMIRADFLEECKDMLGVLRSGKGNYATVYPESDYMNMAITEGGDRAVQYDTSGDTFVPEQPVTTESLSSRAEEITKLYNGYLEDVTMYASTEDASEYDEIYKEFTGLCDEFYDGEISPERASEINKRMGEIEERLRAIGRAASDKNAPAEQ